MGCLSIFRPISINSARRPITILQVSIPFIILAHFVVVVAIDAIHTEEIIDFQTACICVIRCLFSKLNGIE